MIFTVVRSVEEPFAKLLFFRENTFRKMKKDVNVKQFLPLFRNLWVGAQCVRGEIKRKYSKTFILLN